MRWAGCRHLTRASGLIHLSSHATQPFSCSLTRFRLHRSLSTASSPPSSPPRSKPSHSFPLFDYSSSLTTSPFPVSPPQSPLPTSVRIVEVGPRDGLQNEPSTSLTPHDKISFIDRLSSSGLSVIEAASFVSPQWVPSMASSDEVMKGIVRKEGVRYSALTPNVKGLERAMEVKVDEVAVFASASESFSRANLNCSIDESLDRFKPVMERAAAASLPVRGYVSCVIGCPYEGWIDPSVVAEVTMRLLAMGCYEVSLGDTIGVGTPGRVQRLLRVVLDSGVKRDQLAVHFHDTYGQGVVNVWQAVQEGVEVVDSSVAGLGGCPYAVGATGNVATEDVVYMLHGSGVETGVDLRRLIEAGQWISGKLGREVQSRVGRELKKKVG